MTEPVIIDMWMIEVLGDETGNRHRRYLVAARERSKQSGRPSNRCGHIDQASKCQCDKHTD